MNEQNLEQKLIAAYDNMMQRVDELLSKAEHQALPALQKNIEKAKQQAIDLKELTQEEAEKLGNYLLRDLHDAAEHLEHSGEQLSSWFRFDIELIEDRALELFAKVADKTRLELTKLAQQARRAQEYHTGEITSIGTLACLECDTLIHFNKTSRIPPCPKCHKTTFKRTRRK
ncbi:MAG: zinc ribbon-containing protein [Gammaproteobacteria bacterium]|nr:zinc ribbon-containing protein [Gammaproteobacteria bacterium]